ncbi:MAG: GTP-binding protein [Promethearchaeota archaeon]|nr:MAG: GTP-binding protein [Candidatus Lokiarchaeota archaeon]
MTDAFEEGADEVQTHDVYKYRVSYISEKDRKLIFLFVTGLTDKAENIEKELKKCKKEFLDLFGDILDHKFDEKTFEVFDPTIDAIHRNLRPKLSLVGFSGVGKTTITKLIKAEEIPMQHIPTITGDIATIKIGKLHFHLWDFAGQEQFSYLWTNFIKGSDAVLLITDSSLENVEKSKFFLELIKEQAKNAHTAVIGNKQDLDESMKPDQVEDILGLKTYSMTAIDPTNRDKMIQIIADILEMNAEVSPLLQPLLERDKLTEEAEAALENANFAKAATLFEKISDLCIDLGDDSLSKEFYQKSEKIKALLSKKSPDEVPEVHKKEPSKEEGEFEVKRKPPSFVKAKEKVEQTVEIEVTEEEPKKKEPEDKKEELTEEKELEESIDQQMQKEKPLETLKPPTSVPEENIEESKASSQETTLPSKEKLGLKLNPEDFMIKQRPKKVVNVPKDAKKKLKTSAFAHVTNPDEIENAEKSFMKISEPPMEKEMVSDKKESPVQQPKIEMRQEKVPVSSRESEPVPLQSNVATSSKENLEETLMDLKIKKAKISKMGLDFEMQELSGEISAEELEQKKSRLEKLEQKIKNQIAELEELMGK